MINFVWFISLIHNNISMFFEFAREQHLLQSSQRMPNVFRQRDLMQLNISMEDFILRTNCWLLFFTNAHITILRWKRYFTYHAFD